MAGRSTLGVRVISLDEGDRLASLARLEANPEENARAVAEALANAGAVVEAEEETKPRSPTMSMKPVTLKMMKWTLLKKLRLSGWIDGRRLRWQTLNLLSFWHVR